MTNNNSNNNSYMAMTGSGAVKRIRTPNASDVLLGRGGGINSHVGNRVFRDWVHQRKEDYNLAGSKADKTGVAKEVMELVTNKGGRFLTKDPTTSSSASGWWMEVDELRALAKTSQALREGAPQIRASHQGKPASTRKRKSSPPRTKKRLHNPTAATSRVPAPASPPATSGGCSSAWPQTVPGLVPASTPSLNSESTTPIAEEAAHRTISSGTQQALNALGRNMLEAKALAEHQQPPAQEELQAQPLPSYSRPLMSNKEFQQQQQQRIVHKVEEPSSKRPRVEEKISTTTNTSSFLETPPLTSAEAPIVVPPPVPARSFKSYDRVNSLALSDISAWGPDEGYPVGEDLDFVNPFLEEEFHLATPQPSPRTTTPTTTLTPITTPKKNVSSNNGNGDTNIIASPGGIRRNVSSDEGRGVFRQAGEVYGLPPPLSPNININSTIHQNSINNNYYHTSIGDFNDQLRSVMDAAHPEEDITSPPLTGKECNGNNNMPTLLMPFRGGVLQRRYESSGALKKSSSSSGSSNHRSVSIGEFHSQ
jgi:hypothetical protein